jgi:transcriptional regulator with XRE-family HTH domain
MCDSCCSHQPTRTVALPFCHLEFRAARSKPARYPKEINTIGDHIRARRLDLELLQVQVADQIGVHEQTITGWECNATVPEVRYIPAILQFLGYNPVPAASSFPERLAAERRRPGLSQRKMAAKLGVDSASLMSWETRRHQPTEKSLRLIERALQSR